MTNSKKKHIINPINLLDIGQRVKMETYPSYQTIEKQIEELNNGDRSPETGIFIKFKVRDSDYEMSWLSTINDISLLIRLNNKPVGFIQSFASYDWFSKQIKINTSESLYNKRMYGLFYGGR